MGLRAYKNIRAINDSNCEFKIMVRKPVRVSGQLMILFVNSRYAEA